MTIIDVLDSVFQGSDYDLSNLSDSKFNYLIDEVTSFALNFRAPDRAIGSTRFYGGGTIWNRPSSSPAGQVLFGPAGLIYGGYLPQLQTLCLVHDSVVCHDVLSDYLSDLDLQLPSFFPGIMQGEMGTSESPRKRGKNSLAPVLNPLLRFYDEARRLIAAGYLIPVPTKATLFHRKQSILTQLRHSMQDQRMIDLAGSRIEIPVTDGLVNLFMWSPNGRAISVGPAWDNISLRLHYGLLHNFKCFAVAEDAAADYAPLDEFNFGIMQHKCSEFKDRVIKGIGDFETLGLESLLKLPLVNEFGVGDLISIRENEELFDEFRKILNRVIDDNIRPGSTTIDLFKNHDQNLSESIERLISVISKSPGDKKLFKSLSLAAGTTLTASVTIVSSELKTSVVAGVASIPGFYYGIKKIITAGISPEEKVKKIFRKYHL